MSQDLVNEIIENSNESFHEIRSWDELNLDSNILRGIYSYGFENPSPIQRKAILPIISGRDVIAQAQSGTGKTAAFTISALSKVDLTKDTIQVLVLSPTRELTTQTSNVINQIGSMMKDLRVQTVFGGSQLDDTPFFSNRKNPHIVCGCPGRVYDMMRRNRLRANKIKLIILDEADEMLSSGFKDQVYNIFQFLNHNVQVALFSATLPEPMFAITEKFMRNPVHIIVRAEQLTLEGITQYYVAVEDDRQKYNSLKDLYKYISVSQCIIYCNSVKRVTELYEAMRDDEFPVCCIHSKMDKSSRDNAFSEFRTGKSRVMISSNVTARGIDIQQVSIVINFDVPKCIYTYLHRIGRSGRWGRKGVGINFITRHDIMKLREIEHYYACEIKELPASLDFTDKI
jgi:translation initiation factor 4A